MDGGDLLGELRVESRKITVWADTPIFLDQVTTLKMMTHTSIRQTGTVRVCIYTLKGQVKFIVIPLITVTDES